MRCPACLEDLDERRQLALLERVQAHQTQRARSRPQHEVPGRKRERLAKGSAQGGDACWAAGTPGGLAALRGRARSSSGTASSFGGAGACLQRNWNKVARPAGVHSRLSSQIGLRDWQRGAPLNCWEALDKTRRVAAPPTSAAVPVPCAGITLAHPCPRLGCRCSAPPAHAGAYASPSGRCRQGAKQGRGAQGRRRGQVEGG